MRLVCHHALHCPLQLLHIAQLVPLLLYRALQLLHLHAQHAQTILLRGALCQSAFQCLVTFLHQCLDALLGFLCGPALHIQFVLELLHLFCQLRQRVWRC